MNFGIDADWGRAGGLREISITWPSERIIFGRGKRFGCQWTPSTGNRGGSVEFRISNAQSRFSVCCRQCVVAKNPARLNEVEERVARKLRTGDWGEWGMGGDTASHWAGSHADLDNSRTERGDCNPTRHSAEASRKLGSSPSSEPWGQVCKLRSLSPLQLWHRRGRIRGSRRKSWVTGWTGAGTGPAGSDGQMTGPGPWNSVNFRPSTETASEWAPDPWG